MTADAGDAIGKYRILGPLGRGGMGTVFRARDPVLGREVAIKVISPDVEVTAELRARFYREAQACAQLSHPNVVTVHDLGEDGGRLFIVMERLEGEELRQLIAARRPEGLDARLALLLEIVDGLHYAHQRGIIHRDMKPANVIVQPDGHPKIVDFGLARLAGEGADLTRTGLFLGTLRYMAPEQARGQGDRRSDIFATGALGYELFAFRPPFPAEDPLALLDQIRTLDPPPLQEAEPAIPDALDAAIRKALAKDPARRYQDLGQLRADLEAARRDLAEGPAGLARRVRARAAELRALRATLGAGDATEIVVDDTADPSRLAALDVRLAAEIERARGLVAARTAPAPAEPAGARATAPAAPAAPRRRPLALLATGAVVALAAGAVLFVWRSPERPAATPAPSLAASAPGPVAPAPPPPLAPPAGAAVTAPALAPAAPRAAPPVASGPAPRAGRGDRPPSPPASAGATAVPPAAPPVAVAPAPAPVPAPGPGPAEPLARPPVAALAPASPGPPDPAAEVRAAVERYRRAVEARDLDRLRQVRPGLAPGEIRRLRQAFEDSRQHALELRLDDVQVSGAEAEVTGWRRDTVVARDGQTFHNEAGVVFRLRQTPAGWVIVAID